MRAPSKTKPYRPPRSRTTIAVVVAALLCAGFAGSAVAKPQNPPKSRPIFWGALIGRQLTGTPAPWDMKAAQKFAHIAHKKVSLMEFSTPFVDCSRGSCEYQAFAPDVMQRIRDYGAIPFLNWSSQQVPSSPIQPAFNLSQINNGSFDEYIREFAEAAREWGHPFFLRFDWEMNGSWFPWNEGINGNEPGEFVTAWRRVHDIFTAVGATNATWTWCPNIDLSGELTPLREVYPGSNYVDWTCIDGFNWGETKLSAGWMTFDQVFKGTYKRVVKIAPHKPMVIGETASEERGGSKAHWIRQMLNAIPHHYRKIRGLIWFDEKNQNMNWPIESSKSASHAFAKGITRKIYKPATYAHLANGPIRPPTWGPPPRDPPPPPVAESAPAETTE